MASYFSFDGRIPRSSWWMVILPIAIVMGILYALLVPQDGEENWALVVILIVAYVAGIWLNAAATVKRYHDRGKSGAWFFIAFVPIIGGIWQLIECGFLAGNPGPNQYGNEQ